MHVVEVEGRSHHAEHRAESGDGEEHSAAQADGFAGSEREEKASACFGRNDRLTWSVRGLALGGCAGGEFLGSQILGVGGDVPTVSAIVYEAGAAFAVELVGGFAQ
jgi:hypothetical protein